MSGPLIGNILTTSLANKMNVMASPQTRLHPLSSHGSLHLINLTQKVGEGWLDRIGRLDRRRARIQEMNSFIAERLAVSDGSPMTLDAIRTMLCANCSKLHPGLATLCTMQPEISDEKLDRCWLLKGSHCGISRQW